MILRELVAQIGFAVDESGLNVFNKKITEVAGKANALGKDLQSFGTRMSLAVTAPLGLIGGLGVKSISEFDGAMADVRKTTGMTGEALEQIADGIVNMAPSLGSMPIDLAKISAAAGQLGIRGKEDILGFTKDVSMISTALDMTAEEAGTSFAKLRNATGISVQEMSNLGSAINEISNNSAASGKDIVDAMMRSAGELRKFGVTAAQSAALAGAAIASGVIPSAEFAGTSIARFSQISTQNIDKFAKFMGKSVPEMQSMLNKDFVGTLMLTAEKFNAIPSAAEQGRLATEIFTSEGAKLLTALTVNLGQVDNLLKLSNKGWSENTSLLQEHASKIDSLPGAYKVFRATIDAIWQIIGRRGGLIENLRGVVGMLTRLATTISKVNPKVLRSAVTFGMVLAAIGPLAIGIGMLAKAIGASILGYKSVIGWITKLALSYQTLGRAALFAQLKMSLGFLAIIALATMLFFVFEDLYKYFTGGKSLIGHILGDPEKFKAQLQEMLSKGLAEIFKFFGLADSEAVKLANSIVRGFSDAFTRVFESVVRPMFRTIFDSVSSLVEVMSNLNNGNYKGAAMAAGKGVAKYVNNIAARAMSVPAAVIDFGISGNLASAAVESSRQGMANSIESFFNPAAMVPQRQSSTSQVNNVSPNINVQVSNTNASATDIGKAVGAEITHIARQIGANKRLAAE